MTYSFRTNGNFIDFVHTDSTSLQVETVLKSLHNTSRCVDWSLPEDTTRIDFTIDEDKYKNILITEIDFDGTAMNSQDDFETGIIAAFPGLAGSGEEGGSSYLVYTSLLSQTGTNAPVATVLENTLGEVVWTYVSAGVYTATTAGLFTPNKTTVMFGQSNKDGNAILYYYLYDAGNSLDLSCVQDDGTYSNSYMGDCTIEIRVYP